MRREQIIGLCVLLLLAAGTIFAVSRCPAEEADPLSDGERAYIEMLEAAPLAVVEGETISHNQRFLVRTAGTTDIYVSGVRVPEKIQIVDRATDEVLWETEGMVSQQALWSPEGGFLALALSARTWCSVTVIETKNWTSWEFTLPDGSPIPEYTFPAYYEPWGEWRSEHCLDLTLDDGNGGQSHYTCFISEEQGQTVGETWERTEETLPGNYDFNHDGQPETVEISSVGSAHTLRVVDGEGAALWEEEGHTAHVGWTSIFACSIGGQDYLIRYLPTMYQGWADYSLRVFFLNAAGGEQVFYEDNVTWDCNFRMDGHQYDVEALTDFLWDVRGYLESGTLLMSTEDGEFRSNVPGLEMQFYPFGGALRLNSREALREAVQQAEAEWKREEGVTERKGAETSAPFRPLSWGKSASAGNGAGPIGNGRPRSGAGSPRFDNLSSRRAALI